MATSVGQGLDAADLDELEPRTQNGIVGLGVARENLGVGKLVGDTLGEGRELLELETSVHKLLVLQKNKGHIVIYVYVLQYNTIDARSSDSQPSLLLFPLREKRGRG